ncbi:hypothetical protein BJ165DRAFT_1470992 [Panaeolus papilionaceus]|nr:hypothetical protein BJ165DRAFT_1470992 [Panaeolus papilionaceus]
MKVASGVGDERLKLPFDMLQDSEVREVLPKFSRGHLFPRQGMVRIMSKAEVLAKHGSLIQEEDNNSRRCEITCRIRRSRS